MKLSLTFLLTITVAGSHAFPLTGAPAIEERAELKPSSASSGSGSTPSSSASKSVLPKASGSSSPHIPPPKTSGSPLKPVPVKLATAANPFAPQSNSTTRPELTSASCAAKRSDDEALIPRASDLKQYVVIFKSEKYLAPHLKKLGEKLCKSKSQKVTTSSKSTDILSFYSGFFKPETITWIQQQRGYMKATENILVKTRSKNDIKTSSDKKKGRNQARATQRRAPWSLGRLVQREPIPDIHRQGGFDYTYSSDGSGVFVYVVERSVDAGHSELQGKVVEGLRISSAGQGTQPADTHGTMVGSCIAGTKSGSAKGVYIVPVLVEAWNRNDAPNRWVTTPQWFLEAMNAVGRHAIQYGRRGVINYSANEGGWDGATLRFIIGNMQRQGFAFILSAGNSASTTNTIYGPGVAQDDMLIVGAIEGSDGIRYDSSRGPEVNIWAPGTDVLVANPANRQATTIASGTSLAAPLVAGLAARILQVYPTANTNDVIRQILGFAVRNAVAGVQQGHVAQAPSY